MFRNLAGPELLILLVIVVLIFGVGRITKIAGELGGGIRAFRKGLAGDEEKARSAGCDHYVTKPFSPRELLATIGALLGVSPRCVP